MDALHALFDTQCPIADPPLLTACRAMATWLPEDAPVHHQLRVWQQLWELHCAVCHFNSLGENLEAQLASDVGHDLAYPSFTTLRQALSVVREERVMPLPPGGEGIEMLNQHYHAMLHKGNNIEESVGEHIIRKLHLKLMETQAVLEPLAGGGQAGQHWLEGLPEQANFNEMIEHFKKTLAKTPAEPLLQARANMMEARALLVVVHCQPTCCNASHAPAYLPMHASDSMLLMSLHAAQAVPC